MALVVAAVAAILVPVVQQTPGVAYRTWYGPTGSVTSSGQWPSEGSAACGAQFGGNSGAVLELDDGHRVVCIDTGGGLAANGVDVFCARPVDECQLENPAGPMGVTVLSGGAR